MTNADWRADVLKFWFGLNKEQWWRGGPELDHRIKQNFLELWAEKRQLPVERFLDDPLTALAGVILFDQFPRNMFREHAEQFATDHLALAIAKAAIDRKFDEELQPQERGFLYMPFHSSRTVWALMVIPRSRSMSMLSSTCALISRALRPPVAWISRSASVLFPWSMCAMMEKLRILSMLVIRPRR